jgi:predicted ATPase with chaperone activity
MSSRASVFLYGPPGNGKSTIARCMAQLLGEPVLVPYAVAVGDDVVRVLDPIYHRQAEGKRPSDRRLALVARPLVRAGGELQLSQLELTHDPRGRYYEASLQWKACGGVLVIDDFGRQIHSPTLLLNRFIVPMEEGIDYLDLAASGKKIEVPFTCQVVFSTNLAPKDLVDEAFLRRIAHKIYVPDPTPEAYRRIFEREAARRGVQVPDGAVDFVLGLYGDRPLRGSHPKALIAHLVYRAGYFGESPRLEPEALRSAFDTYLNPAFSGRR